MEQYYLRITERGTTFAEKIEIDEEKDLEYFHVPAHNDVTEAADYLYDFENVSQTTERCCLFQVLLRPNTFFRLIKSTSLPDFFSEKFISIDKITAFL